MSNPHQSQPTSLPALFSSLVKNSQLIFQMIKREVIGRYKGSVFGLAWSFFNPILMLTVYTFIFSVVFKSRWGSSGSDSKTEFALTLFVGMIIFNLFSEAINRSPSLIVERVNYVKKVVFPLEILPLVNLGAALFHSLISISVLILAIVIINGQIFWTAFLLPLVLLPLIFLILGISWFLAALGVYVRDIGQFIGVLMTVLMFLSPVFYPISALPAKFQTWMLLNPLSFIIEQARIILITGGMPDLIGLCIYLFVALLIMLLGFAWFQKTRKGFADVL